MFFFVNKIWTSFHSKYKPTRQVLLYKHYCDLLIYSFSLSVILFVCLNLQRCQAQTVKDNAQNNKIVFEALQDTVYILLPPRCKNYCTTFCLCWTPTLRLKMTAMDPSFRWCRLLVLVLWFSQRNCGVFPKKK